MSKEDDSLADILRNISRQKKRIKESPLTQGVRELIDEINQEALEGKGEFSVVVGEQPVDTKFFLEWEGATTKKQKVKLEGKQFAIEVYPY